MKKKILIAVFMLAAVVSVTACGKKDNKNSVEVKGPRVVCTTTREEDGIKVDVTVTLKFNSDNYVNYQLMESTMTFDDKKVYEAYADAMDENEADLGDDIEYSYSLNKSKKQITTTTIYKESLFDYDKVSEEEKAEYKASVIIGKYEDEKATCKFIETTKAKLGIE